MGKPTPRMSLLTGWVKAADGEELEDDSALEAADGEVESDGAVGEEVESDGGVEEREGRPTVYPAQQNEQYIHRFISHDLFHLSQ